MDRKSPPERSSPDPPDMATMVLPQSTGVNKRYRPTPAKTFQCRGFGDCRMVFSRSEHLARHVRKHTGERPFGCHCGKQFSRLDNLRQHAQTVHADKQEQNEAMMRHLTSLHASMAAANKVGHSRGGRRPNHNTGNAIKQEDFSIKVNQRPGTSTGYEGDHNGLLYHQGATWHIPQSDIDRPDSRPSNNHSFRDPGQSFLVPPAATTHSFLPFTATFSFGLPDPTRGDIRPGSSASRPPTAGNLADQAARTLPPLSAVVSASLSTSSQQQQSFFAPSQQQQSSQHILPLPNPYVLRRPTTATRPGTAPASASFFSSSSKPSLFGGCGLASRPELPLSYGRYATDLGSTTYDIEPASPIAGHDSPFFFQPPSVGQSQSTILAAAAAAASPSSSINPRKRAYGGPDGPRDDTADGTESRPQSRRLSVLELCNDDTATGPILLPLSAGARPDTSSSALITSASALAIVDPVSPSSSTTTAAGDSPLLSRAPSSAGGAIPSSGTYARQNPQALGRNALSSSSSPTAVRFDLSRSAPILHHRTGSGDFSSRLHSASPSIGSRSPDTPSFPARNAISPATDAATTLPRRGHGVSPHPSAAVGMRV